MSERHSVTPQDSIPLDAIVRRTLASAVIEHDPTGQNPQVAQLELNMQATVDTEGLNFPHSDQGNLSDLTISFSMENQAAQPPWDEGVSTSTYASDERGHQVDSEEGDPAAVFLAGAIGLLTVADFTKQKTRLEATLQETGTLADVTVVQVRCLGQRVLNLPSGAIKVEYELDDTHSPDNGGFTVTRTDVRITRPVVLPSGDMMTPLRHTLGITSSVMRAADGRILADEVLSSETSAYFTGGNAKGIPPSLAPYPGYHHDEGIEASEYPGGITLREFEEILRGNGNSFVEPVDAGQLMSLAVKLVTEPLDPAYALRIQQHSIG